MKVLIVDDHEYNRELLSFILQDEGYECLFACNGKEACKQVEDHQDIDLILMDVTMPEMDGVTTASVIREKHLADFLPIIFVTALDDADVLAKCLDAGGDDFVPKPINESVLLAKIRVHQRTRELYLKLSRANKKLHYHKQIMDREHMIVERIFNRGANRIDTDCINVKKYTSPVSMFNGDIVLEAPSPSGGIYNLVGDFTGHGLAASIGTLPVTEIFYRLASEQASIGLLAKTINKSLVDLLPENMFFCAALTYLDSEGKGLSLWAGGMNDVLHQSAQDNQHIDRLASEHMPLGVLVEEEFDDTPRVLELHEGDKVYIYTDGVSEATNADGEHFGLSRVESTIRQGGTDIIEHVLDAVHSFQDGEEQNDDISLIEITASRLIHKNKQSAEVVDIKSDAYLADSFPWQFSMRVQDDELRNTNIVDQLMIFVGGIQGIELHREKIFTIISELYSNALEHGVLGLQSSLKQTADGFEQYYRLREERLNYLNGDFIQLEFSFRKGDPNSIYLCLTDSGKGFNYVDVLSKCSEIKEPHGRGIALLQELCASLEFADGGRKVAATYNLCL